jgi:SAM-dependent methyltransferase
MQVKRFFQKIKIDFKVWRHRKRLDQNVEPDSGEYEQYLDLQLRRTLSKSRSSLQMRTRLLVDKAAELVDLSTCEVLCIGCRNMTEVDYFRQKGAKRVVGIDLFSQASDILVMDMHQMTFPDNHFDLIYSAHSLEHAYDIYRVVDEIVRVARPGSYVTLEVPVKFKTRGADLINFENLQTLHKVFEPNITQILWSEEQPPHSPRNDGGTSIVRTIFLIGKGST